MNRRRLQNTLGRMKDRCRNPNNKDYTAYGGRGIKVCEEWLTSFSTFEAWALSAGYDEQLTIDRIDNDGDYTPDNCRWATAKEQARNRSSNWAVTAWGETKLLIEWAEDPRCTVEYQTLHDRLRHDVFDTVELMMTRPPKAHPLVTAWGEEKSASAWARDPRSVVTKGTLLRRRHGHGDFIDVESMITTPAVHPKKVERVPLPKKTCCPHGHPYEEYSAFAATGKRYCKQCNRDRAVANRERRMEYFREYRRRPEVRSTN